ncbi:beta-mannosidase-like [Ixodes scapularis]
MGMGLQPLLAFLVLAEGCSRALCLVLPLNGDWRVYNRNKSYQFSGSVPGNVHTDLMRAKLIGDAYFRDNDEKQAWVAREDWTYSRDFQLSEEVLSHRRILLVAHGIDTIANVYVNDILLGSTENMFVRYRFDIKPHVKTGYNNVTVELSSPVLYAVDRARASARVHAIPPECPPLRQRSVCSANQIRKTQTSFGWEFAPAFPTMGIWKDIGIEIYNVLIIRDMVVRTRCLRTTRPNRWVLDVRLFLELGFSGRKILQLNLEFDKRLTVHKNISISAKNDLTSLYRFRLRIPQNLQVETWWPHGYGKAKLYPLFISLSRGSETATLERSIGFRTIDLVQEPLVNGTGATFFLRVNGVPLFAKGSNWVPADAFQDRVTPERLAQLLDDVVSARMNMLRVWGGGVYESDLFYSMADRRGILVWQDFMFADALYPATPAFLDSVADEARQQIRRLGHHASLVLWCGNSENELGMAYNWWK